MNNNIKNLLTEVSRIKVLMNHQKGNESINEQAGLGKVITRLKSLATNSVDDIAKLGNDKLDELLIFMSKTDSTDDYFESLYRINSIDEAVAKTLRRDTFIQLPLATQKRLKVIKNAIEERIGNIPENELDTIIDNLVRQDFPNESEEVITYLKQSIDDLSETISTKRSAGSVSKSIDDIIDSLTDTDIRNLDDFLMTDEAIRAAFKAENHWSNNMFTRLFVDNRRDTTRALQAYKIDDATKSILKGKTKKEIRELVKKEIKENLDGNEELMNIIKDKSAAARWSRLPIGVKASIASVIFLGGTRWVVAIGGLAFLLRNKSLEGSELVEEAVEEWTEELQTIEEGLFAKLNQDQEKKILKTLHKYDNSLPSEMFDSHGNLVSDKYMINYSNDENSLQILDSNNNYTLIKEYSLNQINKLIKDNQ